MLLVRWIRSLNIRQLLNIIGVLLRNPFFIYPTLTATLTTLRICSEFFGSKQHGKGKENAFRHAFWNIMICRNIYISCKNVDKSVQWAKKITDLHEKVSKNAEMDRIMDLHNNKIGRTCFVTFPEHSKQDIINNLKKKTDQAKKLMNKKELEIYKYDLVYIS